jgi:tRNA-2-methylthio-N6-dimethylallyladenosine synthase
MKTFYIETFGCQMNVHDSEKVIGTLLSQGLFAGGNARIRRLVLYNTCSIRDKAEQKVFSRLQQFKKDHGAGKVFGVLGCVAQQEGQRVFEKAPHVGLVCGSASYNQLPQDAGATGIRQPPRHRSEPRHGRTPSKRPSRAATIRTRLHITIIEGCDKSCAYCVVPFTRGPERSRTGESIIREAHELADAGYTEIQLLGQNVNSYRDPSPAAWDFATLLRNVGKVPGIRRVRFTTSHPRDFTRRSSTPSTRTPCSAITSTCRSNPDPRASSNACAGFTARDEYMRRIEWMKNSPRNIAITTDIIVGFPRRDGRGFSTHPRTARSGRVRLHLQLQILAAPEHARSRLHRSRR